MISRRIDNLCCSAETTAKKISVVLTISIPIMGTIPIAYDNPSESHPPPLVNLKIVS